MSYAEPSDVGPAFGGDRRVHDEDRAKVVTLLDTAHAEGRITAAEHAERLSSAQTAQTFDDLVPLTRDLVAVSQASPTSWNQPQQPSAGGPEPELIVTLFGATERRGRWQARRNLSVLNLFGATELDLRQASFTGNVCEVNVFCLFGSVDVIVPEGTDVHNSALAVFGSSEAKADEPMPGAPSVRVRGFVGFGAIEARVKRLKKK